ncbi:hypothetical protein L0F63_005261 [Massospora cicadina]|nr:hypothetical protein L0F63_005261 [Massospora cicadina]
MIRSFRKLMRGIPAKALPKAFTRPVTVPDDPYLVSSMVENFAKTDRLNDAIVLMFEATKKIPQPIVPWNILLTQVTNQKRMKLAIRLFQEMKMRGVKPNERTYLIMLSGCAKSTSERSPEQAELLLAKMKSIATKDAQAKLNTPAPKDLWKPKICSRVENPSDLIEGKGSNPPVFIRGPSTLHYNNLLNVYSRKNQLVKLITLYDSMCARAKIPDREYSPINMTLQLWHPMILLKTDEGFRQALTIWEDLREDVDKHPEFEEYLAFDSRFLEALVRGSLHCKDKELRFKGLELIVQSFGLKLPVEYPTSASYAELPTLNPRELRQVSQHLKENPRPHILNLALCSLSTLGLHHLVPEVFFALVKPACPSAPFRIVPDIRCFDIVLGSICANARAILKDFILLGKRPARYTPGAIYSKIAPPKPLTGRAVGKLKTSI